MVNRYCWLANRPGESEYSAKCALASRANLPVGQQASERASCREGDGRTAMMVCVVSQIKSRPLFSSIVRSTLRGEGKRAVSPDERLRRIINTFIRYLFMFISLYQGGNVPYTLFFHSPTFSSSLRKRERGEGNSLFGLRSFASAQEL